MGIMNKKSLKEFRIDIEKQILKENRTLVETIKDELKDVVDIDEESIDKAVQETFSRFDENEKKSPVIKKLIEQLVINKIIDQSSKQSIQKLYESVYDDAKKQGLKKSDISKAFNKSLNESDIHFNTNYVYLTQTNEILDKFWKEIKAMTETTNFEDEIINDELESEETIPVKSKWRDDTKIIEQVLDIINKEPKRQNQLNELIKFVLIENDMDVSDETVAEIYDKIINIQNNNEPISDDLYESLKFAWNDFRRAK